MPVGVAVVEHLELQFQHAHYVRHDLDRAVRLVDVLDFAQQSVVGVAGLGDLGAPDLEGDVAAGLRAAAFGPAIDAGDGGEEGPPAAQVIHDLGGRQAADADVRGVELLAVPDRHAIALAGAFAPRC